jgi:UDP-N-acetylmuramoyl-tripeptide--D-alanyl-D-alanine ligase
MQRLYFFMDTPMDIKQLYDYYLASRVVSTDSRNISPGCIFFALKGEHFNGNTFASEAIEKGALAAIVDEVPEKQNPKIIRVDHVLTALQQLARYHRMRLGIPVLAITGSNGKTTTKELCKTVLSESYKVYATEGNLNNHIGVPLTLLSIDDTVEFGIIEMGANHPGEITLLCEIAQPDYGLITNVGKAHLEGFGGIQGVALAKGELFGHLIERGKTLFVNEGNAYVRELIPGSYSKTVWYNGSQGPRIQSMTGDPFLNLRIADKNVTIEIKTGLLGGYNAENVLAAYCVGLHLGIRAELIKHAIQEYRPRNNRSQLLDTGKNKIFMDAYNANPSSMHAAISEFLQFNDPRKLLILGEMRELGDSTQSEHENIVILLKEKGVKEVIFVGEAFRKPALEAGYQYTESVDKLNELLSATPLSGYFVFIKGSRSNKLENVIPLL